MVSGLFVFMYFALMQWAFSLSRKPGSGSGCPYFVHVFYVEGYVNWTGFLQAKFPVIIVRIPDIYIQIPRRVHLGEYASKLSAQINLAQAFDDARFNLLRDFMNGGVNLSNGNSKFREYLKTSIKWQFAPQQGFVSFRRFGGLFGMKKTNVKFKKIQITPSP